MLITFFPKRSKLDQHGELPKNTKYNGNFTWRPTGLPSNWEASCSALSWILSTYKAAWLSDSRGRAPSCRKSRWFCQKWKVNRGSCGLSFIPEQVIVVKSKDIISVFIFTGGDVSSQLPDLFGKIVRGRLWTWTFSRAVGRFPLVYKESGWLFLRLKREKKDILKEEVNLQRTCGFSERRKQASPCMRITFGGRSLLPLNLEMRHSALSRMLGMWMGSGSLKCSGIHSCWVMLHWDFTTTFIRAVEFFPSTTATPNTPWTRVLWDARRFPNATSITTKIFLGHWPYMPMVGILYV